MMKYAKLIETNSYFNIFNILKEQIKFLPNDIDDKTIIFCEEKISLLVESTLCNELNGSFSMRVFSFGNYLRMFSPTGNVLSREGSVMAIRRLLKTLPLKCFLKSKKNMASKLYDLIVQLKSAKVTPDDIKRAYEFTDGVLKNKLEDILTIFSAYEQFIKDNNFDDQSSVLSNLPELFNSDENIKDTNIILLGFTSLTRQALFSIETLLHRAKSMTAIFTAGENSFAFVNEVSNQFLDICSRLKISVSKEVVDTEYSDCARKICENLFNPSSFKLSQVDCDSIYTLQANDSIEQFEKVGEIIKASVLRGARYRDFSIALPDRDKEQFVIKNIFERLDISYFLDTKKKANSTALVSLILSYIEVFRKNMARESVYAFVKNPLFILDKNISDNFENYLIRYNINYSLIKQPFTLAVKGENITELNEIREKLCELFENFNIRKMLKCLDVENKQKQLSTQLFEFGFNTNSAVNEQVYDAVENILNDMDLLLGKDCTLTDVKETFESGIDALEISILPQYKDAVFIGDYRQTAIVQNSVIFALNLNQDVPEIKEDISILCDDDIEKLENIKILIEPKVKIVNHRSRESIAMALSSFSKKLYLCCPSSTESGKKNMRSEVFSYLEKMFTIKINTFRDEYLTFKQGLYSFGKDCTMFVDGRKLDIMEASNYYYATKPNEIVNKVLKEANREVCPVILTGKAMVENVTSPTKLEEYSKCPYRAFIRNYLNVKERDIGETDALSTGVIIHAVFEKYAKRIDEVCDRDSSDKIAEEIFNEIIKGEEYIKYLSDEKESETINRIFSEAKEFCYKIFLSISHSKFKPLFIEKSFGDGREGSLPPIKLLNGKVNLKGKIDRVDMYDKYIRVIDYKTGNCDIEKENLFYGSKLQLYLYSRVFKDKLMAGHYYMPISNSFKSDGEKSETMFTGDSLGDKEVLTFQDDSFSNGTSLLLPSKIKGDKIEKAYTKEELESFSKYALYVSERIAKNMCEGFIPASPLKNECVYCQFRDICDESFLGERNIGKVDEETIIQAVEEEENELHSKSVGYNKD